ncbi:MAG: hypothetical protein ACXAAH_00265 [Promethearchaeota archaeon]
MVKYELREIKDNLFEDLSFLDKLLFSISNFYDTKWKYVMFSLIYIGLLLSFILFPMDVIGLKNIGVMGKTFGSIVSSFIFLILISSFCEDNL